MAQIGVIAASTTSIFSLSYVPQTITFSNITSISRVRVTVNNAGIICDLDIAGINSLKNTRSQSIVTGQVELMLANGIAKGKNCIIEVTNGATVASLFASSYANQTEATVYVQSAIQRAYANTPITFNKFAVLGFPSMGASDYGMLETGDGLQQKVDQIEWRNLLSKLQMVENNANDLKLDNLDAWVKGVTLYLSADQNVYIQRYIEIL